MISAIKDWILQIAGTALIAAAVLSITPEGRAKKAVTIVCGAAVIIALLSITVDFDYSSYSRRLAEYKSDIEEYAGEIGSVNKNLTKAIIEEESKAYILDKGKEIGITELEVSVTTRWEPDGQYWYPVSVKINAAASEGQKEDLSYYIEASLGIPRDEQIWSTYDEG